MGRAVPDTPTFEYSGEKEEDESQESSSSEVLRKVV
jgi:hypothetical protein